MNGDGGHRVTRLHGLAATYSTSVTDGRPAGAVVRSIAAAAAAAGSQLPSCGTGITLLTASLAGHRVSNAAAAPPAEVRLSE